jgi:hypothetical protein
VRWLRFFDALARGEKWATRGLLAWIATILVAAILITIIYPR